MIAIKTILLPTDGSDSSKKATAYAFSFGKQYSARLVVLHVIDQRWVEHPPYVLLEAGQEAAEKIRKGYAEEAEYRLREVAEAATKAGVAVETRLEIGIPVEEIIRVAKGLPADMIIMGTHGRTGVSHALLGSVAEKVVRRAPCPVLTVRPEEHDFISP